MPMHFSLLLVTMKTGCGEEETVNNMQHSALCGFIGSDKKHRQGEMKGDSGS